MRVRAKNRGIYGPRRWQPGMEFTLDDPRQFNGSWMEEIKEPQAPAKRGPGRPKKQPKPEPLPAQEKAEA